MIQHSHLGIYALIRKNDNLLLIRKARGPYTGRWDLPGGSVEFGETPRETLHREVMEETGLSVFADELLDAKSATFRYITNDGQAATLHHLGILYQVEVQEQGLKTEGDGEDALGAAWVSLFDLDEENSTPFVLQCIAHLREQSI